MGLLEYRDLLAQACSPRFLICVRSALNFKNFHGSYAALAVAGDGLDKGQPGIFGGDRRKPVRNCKTVDREDRREPFAELTCLEGLQAMTEAL